LACTAFETQANSDQRTVNSETMRIPPTILVAVALVAVACGDDMTANIEVPDSGNDAAFHHDADVDAASDAANPPDAEYDAGPDTNDAGPEPFDYGSDPPGTCNGAAHLCDRRLDEVAYVTTHNAYSTQEEGYIGPNQTFSMRQQLADGVRGLMLDTYDNGEFETSLCHSTCRFGERSLESGLRDIADFLAARPANVVTLILESYISGAQFQTALRAAGLADRVWVPQGDGALPTLRELIDADTQLVVLTNRDAGAFPGYLDVWSLAWDTDWNNQELADFDCGVLRGSTDNPLFILNHFLTDPVANTFLAGMANKDPVLSDRVAQCEQEAGQMPNYIAVDFYEIGSVFEVVDALNAP
jgi:hypothetical protein